MLHAATRAIAAGIAAVADDDDLDLDEPRRTSISPGDFVYAFTTRHVWQKKAALSHRKSKFGA